MVKHSPPLLLNALFPYSCWNLVILRIVICCWYSSRNVHKKKKVSNYYLCSKELYPLSTCCLCVFMLLILGTENRRANEVMIVPEEQDAWWDHCCWHQSCRKQMVTLRKWMAQQLGAAGGTRLARGQMWILHPLYQGDVKNWWFGQKEERQIRR